MAAQKTVFPSSFPELKFAMAQGKNYCIYRVFGAGRPDVKLIRIDNIAERIVSKEIKLLFHM